MRRLVRLASLLLVVAAAFGGSGCFNKHEFTTLGETEGIYVTVDGLKYQIQISRILNPDSPEDQAYLRGIPETETELAEDDVWFGIFMRVENDGEEPRMAADEFAIHDTQDVEFEPLDLEPEANVFVYEPRELAPGKLIPEVGSPASESTIQGSLILFKVKTTSLGNRPLEFEIVSPSGGENGIIELDI